MLADRGRCLVSDRVRSGVSRSRFLIFALDRVSLLWLFLVIISLTVNFFLIFFLFFWVFAVLTEVYHSFNILEGFSCDWRLC